MKFNTLRFGEIEIKEEAVVLFAEGLPGFESQRQFTLIPYDAHSPYMFLQSLSDEGLAFLVVDPFQFFADYHFEIDNDSLEELDISDEHDVDGYVILTVPGGDIKEITANLLAPLVINQKNRRAKQIVLGKSQYTTKHKIFASQASVIPEGGK